MTGISKFFGQTRALENVDLAVEQGTIHALVGENGAGKTTLMRILYGALQPDSGSIELDGSPEKLRSSANASAKGIGMVSQHYGIIPELTCLENLILGAEGGPVVSRSSARKRADSLAEKMGFRFDWDARASELSPSGNQKLEILKLLWRNAKILILDEPTAMLSPLDGEALFTSLSQLVDEGATVLLVTHRLPEVMAHCKSVTVLRGGKKVSDHLVSLTSKEELSRLIVGQGTVVRTPPQPRSNPNVLLEVSRMSVMGDRGDLALKQVSFDLHREEVLGIAGVDGNGQRELIQALVGVRRADSGFARFEGSDVLEKPVAQRIRLGFRLIPESRHEEGVIESWSIEENAALGLHRFMPFAKRGLVLSRGRAAAARQMARRYDTRYPKITSPMASLSGGNQQRFVVGRALELWPTLILAFQPTRGLDIRASERVYNGIREVCREGAGALIVSFDLDELLEHCDRVLVLNRGIIKEPPKGQERDRIAIGRLMVGDGG